MYATALSRASIHLFQPKINFLSCTFLTQWRSWRFCMQKTTYETFRAQISPRSWGGSGTTCMPLHSPGPQSTYFNQKSTFCRAHSSRSGALGGSVCKKPPMKLFEPKSRPAPGGALGPHVCHCTLQGLNPPISTKNQLFVVHIPHAVALLAVLYAKNHL